MSLTARAVATAVWVTIAASACAPVRPAARRDSEPTALPSHIRVKVSPRGAVRTIALEDYVQRVVIAEAGAGAEDVAAGAGMLDVQAVIARTYAVAHRGRHAREGYDLCATTHCQAYDPRRLQASGQAEAIRRAVRRTAATILWHGTRPAAAVFHADCGGHTSAARDVWGSAAHPYLAARSDDGPAETAHRAWRFETGGEALRRALNRDARTRVGARFVGITVAARDQAGRATRIRLEGQATQVVRGEDLRDVVNGAFGPHALRSTRFDVRPSASGFRFDGRGYGHGVGLCQVGALARLRSGASVSEVLARYYPGTSLAAAP